MPRDLIKSEINLNMPGSTPDGFLNPEVRAAVEIFINSINNLLRSVEQYLGITQKDMTTWNDLLPSDTLLAHQLNRAYITAGENIAFGQFVNLYNDAGVLKCRRAEGTAGTVRPARGFCSTSGGILAGSRGEVILNEGILAVSGILPGESIFLSTTPGDATVTALTGAGELEQFLGFGIASSLAYVKISQGSYVQH